ncbi:MAG TPA: hypothetical protein VFR09_07260 [Alphaproteobacteria bacterium]|nr:hypothetical protein [Alphaproteobacteria bacterium]
MQRLKQKLEELDEAIFALEDKIGLDTSSRRETSKKQNEILKQIRTREATVLGTAQKVAARLDKAIENVENVLRN